MDQMIVGDPKRTVWHKPDRLGQLKRASVSGNRRKGQEKAAEVMAQEWKADFEARVRARMGKG